MPLLRAREARTTNCFSIIFMWQYNWCIKFWFLFFFLLSSSYSLSLFLLFFYLTLCLLLFLPLFPFMPYIAPYSYPCFLFLLDPREEVPIDLDTISQLVHATFHMPTCLFVSRHEHRSDRTRFVGLPFARFDRSHVLQGADDVPENRH